MSNHRYILEPYKGRKTRHHCPACQHKERSFTLYIDATSMEYLSSKVGRCNRESNCGYHYTPKQYFQDHNFPINRQSFVSQYQRRPLHILEEEKPVSFIDENLFKASLGMYEQNHFISFLVSKFGISNVAEVIKKYFIGSSNYWEGATVFWQVDKSGYIRTGKIMLYSPTTGKRVKEPRQHITWVHSALELPNYRLKQALFGEHLLNDNALPCALVESEKSAVIASMYFPQFIWLATGSLSNLTDERCRVLKDRKVILFPDLKGYEKWKSKASEIKSLSDYTISDLLERKASDEEKSLGLDIADYLLKYSLSEFHPIIEKVALSNQSNFETRFEDTQIYENLMFDMVNKYFYHPLLSSLLKETPFSNNWNQIYLQIRKSERKRF